MKKKRGKKKGYAEHIPKKIYKNGTGACTNEGSTKREEKGNQLAPNNWGKRGGGRKYPNGGLFKEYGSGSQGQVGGEKSGMT